MVVPDVFRLALEHEAVATISGIWRVQHTASVSFPISLFLDSGERH